MSNYFRAIRSWQEGYTSVKNGKMHKNLLRPCPMRDHYKYAHNTIMRFQAKPMDQDAARAIGDEEYHKRMEDYNDRVGKLLDPIWDERY